MIALHRKDIRRMFGSIDDHRVLEILEMEPTLKDLEVANAYLADMSDVMGEERNPLDGKAAGIYEIVTRDEPLEDD